VPCKIIILLIYLYYDFIILYTKNAIRTCCPR
jgi:hypothetical protein